MLRVKRVNHLELVSVEEAKRARATRTVGVAAAGQIVHLHLELSQRTLAREKLLKARRDGRSCNRVEHKLQGRHKCVGPCDSPSSLPTLNNSKIGII